jgi:hypothetical protein
MLRVLELLVSPSTAWPKIVEADRSAFFLIFLVFLPLSVVCLGAEAAALVRWGLRQNPFGFIVPVPGAVAVRYVGLRLAMDIACVFGVAAVIKSLAGSFHLRTTGRQTITIAIYGLCPLILARLLVAVPSLPAWASFVVGAIFCTSVLYHGVGLVLRPDQTHGFGLYMLTVLTVAGGSGLAYVIGLGLLRG